MEDIFVRADDLENIPHPNRLNYEFEHTFLINSLPHGAQVLQVGSMDGIRAVRLLRARPDLRVTGLEIEAPLLELAKRNVTHAGLNAAFVLGDITNPPELPRHDFVVCLNNTLGYIPDDRVAITAMRALGERVVVSVYGEKFTDALATEYFESLGLKINAVVNNVFILRDFSHVRRYTRADVVQWEGRIIETPIGYLSVIGESTGATSTT